MEPCDDSEILKGSEIVKIREKHDGESTVNCNNVSSMPSVSFTMRIKYLNLHHRLITSFAYHIRFMYLLFENA